MKPREALVFRRRDGAREASSLSHLVALEPRVSLDDRALFPRVLVLPPNEEGETPYREVACAPAKALWGSEAAVAEAYAIRGVSDAKALMERLLFDAIDRVLKGLRRVAVMTGGGLDSGGLLALVSERGREVGCEVFAVTLDFEADGDDRPHMRALEATLGCEVLRMAPEEAVSSVSLYRGVDAAPFTWPTGAMEIELMRRAKERGAECVFTGAGGDQLFDGDPRSLAATFRRGEWWRAWREARKMVGFRRPRRPFVSWVARPLLAGLAPRAVRRRVASRAPLYIPEWAGPALIDWIRRGADAAFADVYASEERARFAAARDARRDREYLLWLRHQQEVTSDVARCDPYDDPALVGAAAAMPSDLLIAHHRKRGLFREIMRGRLPESVRQRDDKAAFEPAIERFVDASSALGELRELGDGRELAARGIVELSRFRRATERLAKGERRAEDWVTLWPALCVDAFLATSRTRGIV